MLKFTGRGSITTCDGITRRDFLQVGTLGAIGLSLSKFAELQAMGAAPKGNDDRSCIMIFNLGAPSQIDAWRHEAGCTGRNSWAVQTDSHE